MSTTAEIKAVVDDLASTWEDFKSANDDRLSELEKKGASDVVTRDKVTKINKRIDQLEVALQRPDTDLAGNDNAPKERKHAAEFLTQMSGQLVRINDNFDMAAYREYRTRVSHYIRYARNNTGPDEERALQVGGDADGGYFVTPDMNGRIVQRIFESSPVRALASVVTVGSDALEGLTDNDEAGVGWVGENDARTATTTPQIGKYRIDVNEIYAHLVSTQRLLDDAQFDVEAWLFGKASDRFARTEATAFVTGNGVSKPRGFMDYGTDSVTTADATRAWGVLQHVVSGSAAALTFDGFIILIYTLKAHYRANAHFAMNRLSVSVVRKLKDGNGQYLWQPNNQAGQPSELLGYPISEMEDLVDVSAGVFPLAFGDFRAAYTIVEKQGTRVLRDPYTSKPNVVFYTTRRVGGNVVDFEALKLMKISA